MISMMGVVFVLGSALFAAKHFKTDDLLEDCRHAAYDYKPDPNWAQALDTSSAASSPSSRSAAAKGPGSATAETTGASVAPAPVGT